MATKQLQDKIDALEADIDDYRTQLRGQDLSPDRRELLQNLLLEARRRLNIIDPRQQQLAPAPAPAPGKIYTSSPTESPPLYIRTTQYPLYVKTVLSF